MKKFIFGFLFALVSIMNVNAQSFELHQSYNDKNSAWGSSRLLTEYFWSSDNKKWNVFSWNSFSSNGISALLYGEYSFAKNFFVHPEVRVQFGKFEYADLTSQIGFAYLIPWKNGADIYLTPKYSYNDVYASKHDIQFSVNSAYENDKVYYEGYLDTNWINAFNIFTEQKAYYKITNVFQVGASVVFNATSDYHNDGAAKIQPYLSVRVALY